MNRVCLLKDTGDVIEYQKGGYVEGDEKISSLRLSTLYDNAIKQGYTENQIEVKWVTDDQLHILMNDTYAPTKDEIENRKIEEMISLKIREQALSALKEDGKLDSEGRLKIGVS